MHFARSIVLGYQSIPKIKRGSFRGRREEKWRSFRGRFGDHFRAGDHFGVGIISEAVQFPIFGGREATTGNASGVRRLTRTRLMHSFFRGGGGVGGLNKYRGKCETGYPSFIGLHYNQTSQ